MSNPYKNLEDYNFWNKAMTTPAPGHIDPVTESIKIKVNEKVATMGSCFAQHMSRIISESGFNYYVAEKKPLDMSDEISSKLGYGVFSARYGNIYTARQAVQLFDRAYGLNSFDTNIWKKGDSVVDAFRPTIIPHGYNNAEMLLESRAEHLKFVRDIFENTNWLILTLGLTETWRSKADGAVFPVAPGISGGTFSSDKFEFVNYDVWEVVNDLRYFVNKAKGVNPNIKILLTVSPVPLIATRENRHVLVSTTVSKAILRVSADMITKEFDSVLYFPSYEIITSPAAGSRYYADDLRQVTNLGVNHVMRIFKKHFLTIDNESKVLKEGASHPELMSTDAVVCDEELIENTLKSAGFVRN